MGDTPKKTVTLTKDLIVRIKDINQLHKVCTDLFVQREKLLKTRTDLQTNIESLKLESQCNIAKIETLEEMVRTTISEKEELENQINAQNEQINSLKIGLQNVDESHNDQIPITNTESSEEIKLLKKQLEERDEMIAEISLKIQQSADNQSDEVIRLQKELEEAQSQEKAFKKAAKAAVAQVQVENNELKTKLASYEQDMVKLHSLEQLNSELSEAHRVDSVKLREMASRLLELECQNNTQINDDFEQQLSDAKLRISELESQLNHDQTNSDDYSGLKVKLAEANNKISDYETVIEQQIKDNEEVVNALTDEINNLKSQLKSSEDSNVQLKVALESQDDAFKNSSIEISQLQDQLKAAEIERNADAEQFAAKLHAAEVALLEASERERLKDLEIQKSKSDAGAEKQSKDAENSQLREEMEALKHDLGKKKSQIDDLTELVSAKDSELHEIKNQITTKESDILKAKYALDATDSHLKQVREDLSKCQEENTNLNQELDKVKKDLAEAKEKARNDVAAVEERAKKELADRAADGDNLAKVQSEFAEERQKMLKTIHELSDSLENEKKESLGIINNFKAQVNTLEKERNDLKNENALLNSLEEEIKEKTKTIDTLSEEIVELKQAAENAGKKLSQQEENSKVIIDNLKEEFTQKQSNYELLQKEFDDAKNQITESMKENENLKSNINSLELKLTELNNAKSEAETNIKQNETIISDLKAENDLLRTQLSGQLANLEESSREQATKHSEEVKTLTDQLNTTKSQLESAQKESDIAKKSFEAAKKALEDIRGKFASLKSQSERTNIELRQSQDDNEALKKQKAELSLTIKTFESESSKLKSEIESKTSEITKLKNLLSDHEKLEEESKKLRSQITELENDREGSRSLATALKRTMEQKDLDIQKLNNSIKELEAKYSNTKSSLEKVMEAKIQVEANLKSTDEIKRDLDQRLRISENSLKEANEEIANMKESNATLEAKINALNSELETAQFAASSEVIVEKDKYIDKLKTLVQRYVRSEKRSQQQIEELQKELAAAKESGPLQIDYVGNVSRLEAKIRELEARLEGSQTTKELEERCRKMQRTVEKSNHLYSQLLEQNHALQTQLKDAQHAEQPKKASVAVAESEAFEVMEIVQVEESHKEGDEMMSAYLRRVLLQFFMQDDTKRDALVPLILGIVGCTEGQINAAVKQWERQNTIIEKTTGFFSFI